MLENSALKIVANKLAHSSLTSGSLIIVGGIVVWRLWSNQQQIQAKIKELSGDMDALKKQVSDSKLTTDDGTESSLFPTFRKIFGGK